MTHSENVLTVQRSMQNTNKISYILGPYSPATLMDLLDLKDGITVHIGL